MINTTKLKSALTWAFIIIGFILNILLRQSDLYSPILFLTKALTPFIVFGFSILAIGLLIVNKYLSHRLLISLAAFSLLIMLSPHYTIQTTSDSLNQLTNEDISLMTISAMGRTQNNDDIKRIIAHTQTDVSCIQEVDEKDYAVFQEIFSYHTFAPSGLLIGSNHPLHAISHQYGVQIASLLLDNKKIGIVNVHMEKLFNQRELTAGWHYLFEAISNSNFNHILVCGDLNATPFNTVYSLLMQYGLSDAHKTAQGFGFTFPHKQRRYSQFGPFARIDYILGKRVHFNHSYTVISSDQSDHKAVYANFTLEQD